jgi:uncharacterized repeat protein (TIGR03943 family)
VNRRDAACTTFAVGLLTLWMALTNAMLNYLKPSMRPWLLLAGSGLVAIGVFGFVRSRVMEARSDEADHAAEREPDHEHAHEHHHSRVGWFLVVPILVVIAVGTQSLGSFAASRAGSRALPDYSFDIAGFAHDQGQSVPSLEVLDVYLGAKQSGNRQYLLAHDVLLRGFVTRDATAANGGFVLNRFLISCCAADATLLSVAMTGAAKVPSDNSWVEVRARLLPQRPPPTTAGDDGPKALFRVRTLRHVPAPSNPYEGLR